jgi:hypothetical protein
VDPFPPHPLGFEDHPSSLGTCEARGAAPPEPHEVNRGVDRHIQTRISIIGQ